MPLSLEQYADYLDTRTDLNWPAPPAVERPKAKPHVVPLPGIRAVTWSIYGTLLNIFSGELLFEHPQKFIMDVALDKTIQEFKMWQAMSRKPGQPAEYMKIIYTDILSERRMTSPGGEVASDKVWEAIIKRLLKNEYVFDASFFGSLDDFARKIAYFFHASLQRTECYPGAANALEHVHRTLGSQGVMADGQCFTMVQLARGLRDQSTGSLNDLIPDDLRVLSYEFKARKPAEQLFEEMHQRLQARGIEPQEVLHVGSHVTNDIIPAKKLGMRTGLFAGDKGSLQATPEQLKRAECRPDVMLTELEQIIEIVSRE